MEASPKSLSEGIQLTVQNSTDCSRKRIGKIKGRDEDIIDIIDSLYTYLDCCTDSHIAFIHIFYICGSEGCKCESGLYKTCLLVGIIELGSILLPEQLSPDHQLDQSVGWRRLTLSFA